MRYEVPQFIEVEQKIIGPFTWRQFIYIAGGIGALAVTFLTLPFYLFLLIGVPVAALAGMLAFQKVNNRPFAVLLEAGFNFITRNRMYLWSIDNNRKYTVANYHEAPTEVAPVPDAAKAPPSGNLSALNEKLSRDDTAANNL